VFWVNVPFVLACAALAPLVLPGGRPQERAGRFDLGGAFAVTLGLTALIYGLVEIAEVGAGAPRTVISLIAAVLLLGLFVLIERRVADPIVPFRIFRSVQPRSANIIMLSFAAGVVAMNFFMTLYLQQVLGYDATRAGLAFLPMAIGQILFSNVASRLIGRLGVATTMLIGLIASAVSFLWFAQISPTGGYLSDLIGPVVLLSVGGGFTIVPLYVTATSGIEMSDMGIAGGLINMSQQVGGAIGLAGLSTLAVWRTDQIAHDAAPDAAALTSGFQLGFLIAAALVVVAAVPAWLMLRREARTAPAGAETPAPDALEPSPTQAS
jgi:predicted MFS family arabinose efflux permease